MQLKSLYTKINGVEKRFTVMDKTRAMQLAELEDGVKYYKEQIELSAKIYSIILGKELHANKQTR